MVVTAWVMLELTGDRPASVGDSIAMRGDNIAAVTWVNNYGGARDKRACLLMRMLGRLEIKGGWSHVAKHVPGVENTLADGISSWPRAELARKVRELTNSTDWMEQKIGPRGSKIFDLVLRTKNIVTRHDDRLWNIMVNEPDTV